MNNMMDLELYKKTKKGVEYRLIQRKKIKRNVTLCLMIGILFLGINITAYASSKEYRSWLSNRLGVKANSTISVEKSIINKKINMEILSYYRVNNTVVMSLRFSQSDEKTFSEDLNIQYIKIDKNKNSSGEILSLYSNLSDDKKSILTMLTMDVQTKKIIIDATNLVSMATGEKVYNGNWKLEVDVSEQTGDMGKINKVIPTLIKIQNKEYRVKDIYYVANALFFNCDVKTIEKANEDRYSSVYGGQITLEYKNGEKDEEYYCTPDRDGNLVLFVEEAYELENLSQIYIDGKKVLK